MPVDPNESLNGYRWDPERQRWVGLVDGSIDEDHAARLAWMEYHRTGDVEVLVRAGILSR